MEWIKLEEKEPPIGEDILFVYHVRRPNPADDERQVGYGHFNANVEFSDWNDCEVGTDGEIDPRYVPAGNVTHWYQPQLPKEI